MSERYIHTIPKTGAMRVPVKVFASEALYKKMEEDGSLTQAKNVASLPGIVGESIVMPDAHVGYGFSIGGVAAFDMHEGIISPGGIGFDINCGVRVLTTDLTKSQVVPKLKELLDRIYELCPVGVGAKGVRITQTELDEVMLQGAQWAVEHGYGTKEDLQRCEAGGCLPEANPKDVPTRAKQRGSGQLGTVGAGNHFIEIQTVHEIYNPLAAEAYGITREGQVVIMIHCGSRGFGHQICADYIRMMEEQHPEIAKALPDRDLIYAPITSTIAKKYWGAMNAAANFAFCNRHILGEQVRRAIKATYGDETDVRTLYDVCHNIAKRETHTINGESRELLVHRKGATRAFPAGSEEIPEEYKNIGQPVLIPGSMGTASYILAGHKDAMDLSFGSTAHGAGRMMSRVRAKHDFPADIVTEKLKRQGIMIKAATMKGIAEEAPGAYKDVDEVIDVSDKLGIARKVVRLVPIGVIKG